jgi:hypothetical protein
MGAEGALLVAARYIGADGSPESLRAPDVPAEGVPGKPRVLVSQRSEASGGQSAPLVTGQRVGLLDPAQAAASTDLVVDGECEFTVEV